MKMDQLSKEFAIYEESFSSFRKQHSLPDEWFEIPDHVAVKCADGRNYAQLCNELSEMTVNGVWEIELDGRFLGSARLHEPIHLLDYNFSLIEVMQPRPGKETDFDFVEHTEFLFADFAAVQAKLEQIEIEYELQENPGHKWINIVIDDMGREIKINNKVLADVVVWEREEGNLKKRVEK